ncbi:hypothetical protein ACFL96_10820 [Thermoproteota archaeon]
MPNIPKFTPPPSEWEHRQQRAEGVRDAASVILGVDNEQVRIQRSKIKNMSKGLSEVAYSMGQTNDVDKFAEFMAEDIFEAFKELEKRRRKGLHR